MRILLLSMPDSFEHTPTLTIRMPNLALGTLAANVDSHHIVSIADLILVQRDVRATVERLIAQLEPDVCGLSIMTFQRRTAFRLIALLRSLRPSIRIVVGGYDPSLAPEAYADPELGIDAIVRGEGDVTFRELLRALEAGRSLDTVEGVTWLDRTSGQFRRTPDRHVLTSLNELRLPKRNARVLHGYTFLGRQVDVIETSRGCTFDCAFCSIIEMRGRNFFTRDIDHVIADIRDARAHGARAIFMVDDNITLDAKRFTALCQAIIDAGLADIDYLVQAMTSSIANASEDLAELMGRAGFRYVFLGIENVLDDDLAFLHAQAKNAQRDHGHTVGNATLQAITRLHRHGMFIVGGLIVGSPGDTREAIETNLAFARRYVDWPYIQHPTPYPRTPMTRAFREQGLIVNERLEEYDGTTAVVRSEHLEAEEIEFLRWRAERWMKVRHFPVALAHDPWFVLRHARRMFAHTFRGSRWRSWLGLEDPHAAFGRYREIRRGEREYLPPTLDPPQRRQSAA